MVQITYEYFTELRDKAIELSKLKTGYDKLDEAYDNLVDENYALTCERDRLKRTCESKDAYISNLQTQISDLREQISRRNSKIVELKTENFNLREELKSALEVLHDQYDDDKPCCKKCVHCRPFVGSTDCYCSQTGELIKNEHAETYYCKEMIPYEDDYPF